MKDRVYLTAFVKEDIFPKGSTYFHTLWKHFSENVEMGLKKYSLFGVKKIKQKKPNFSTEYF